MPIYIGNSKIKNIPIANTQASKVYVGEERIFPDTPINAYIDNIVCLGGDANTVREGYSNVPHSIKDKASVILFPSYTDISRVYAMDNNTGEALPVYYNRGSIGTYFDKDLNLQLAENNTPRIDYGNYSKDAKILIEKESTNLQLRSSAFENAIGYNSYTTVSDIKVIDDDARLLSATGTASNARLNINNTNRIPITEDLDLSLSFLYRTNTPISNTGGKYFANIETDPFSGTSIRNRTFSDGFLLGESNISLISSDTHLTALIYIYLSIQTVEFKYFQVEKGIPTSYIPTTDTVATRSADIMKINLLKDCKVYIKTTKEETYLDKPAGVWNIQDDITESDGILCLAIMNDEAFDRNTYFDLYNFSALVTADGGIVDESALLNSYANLSTHDRAGDLIVIPGAYKEGYIYGIKPDFTFELFPFSRASQGTRITKESTLEIVGNNIPRIDYGNYSKNVKILIEKENINNILNSNNELKTSRSRYNIGNPSIISGRNDVVVSFDIKKNNTNNNLSLYLTYNNDSGVISTLTASHTSFSINNTEWERNTAIITCTGEGSDKTNTLTFAFSTDNDFSIKNVDVSLMEYSSHIITTNSVGARSSDLLSYTLKQDYSVYLKTTKQNIVLDKSAGVWNIHEDLNNEGIISLSIIQKDTI